MSVAGIDKIESDCHLSAFASGPISPLWTSDNVLDLASHFLLNPYIDIGRFSDSQPIVQ